MTAGSLSTSYQSELLESALQRKGERYFEGTAGISPEILADIAAGPFTLISKRTRLRIYPEISVRISPIISVQISQFIYPGIYLEILSGILIRIYSGIPAVNPLWKSAGILLEIYTEVPPAIPTKLSRGFLAEISISIPLGISLLFLPGVTPVISTEGFDEIPLRSLAEILSKILLYFLIYFLFLQKDGTFLIPS